MSGYEALTLVLLLGGVAPAVLLASLGRPTKRLIGLELAGSVVTVVFLLMAQSSGLSYELILPLVLVPLSLAGTLVYTRLLAPRRPE